MQNLFTAVECIECGHQEAATMFPTPCSECGSPWIEARYKLADLPKDWIEQVQKRPTNMWRYHELLPFDHDFTPVSMGEGWTPLIQSDGLAKELGLKSLWLKDERQQPTGSFKDRQASAAVTALKAEGVKELVLASTGNAAAAYSAFAARAGMKMWVFLPSNVPAEKMRELALYGTEVIKITGTYDQAKKIASDFASRRELHFDKGAKAIPDKEAMKTVAFEIVEQLDWNVPDWYIQAVSGGLGPLGILKGFKELKEVGIIDKIPKVGIVQVDGCSPMVQAWEAGQDFAHAIIPDTLITVLSTGEPGYAYVTLKQAIDENGGAMVSVSDGDAFRAMRRLARSEGFSVEPATSVAFAGLEKLIEKGHVQSDETIVVNVSGHTFSAEKHALEDRYFVALDMASDGESTGVENLEEALVQLDEQVTSIVVVDDNAHHSRLLRRLLARYKKYRVFEANDPADGLALIMQKRPDLVVLDLTMPEVDGFDILEAMKADDRTKDIPVMIVSGVSWELSAEQKEYLKENTSAMLEKGNFSGIDLINNVADTLGHDLDVPERPIYDPSGPKLETRPATFVDATRPTILVVEDNVWEARLYRRLLEAQHRFNVLLAYTAKEAFSMIEESTPDLIMLDLMLPDLNGEELLNTLRENEETKRIPVIIISAKDIDARTRAQLSNMADSIWGKTMLDRSNLLEHVQEILKQ